MSVESQSGRIFGPETVTSRGFGRLTCDSARLRRVNGSEVGNGADIAGGRTSPGRGRMTAEQMVQRLPRLPLRGNQDHRPGQTLTLQHHAAFDRDAGLGGIERDFAEIAIHHLTHQQCGQCRTEGRQDFLGFGLHDRFRLAQQLDGLSRHKCCRRTQVDKQSLLRNHGNLSLHLARSEQLGDGTVGPDCGGVALRVGVFFDCAAAGFGSARISCIYR